MNLSYVCNEKAFAGPGIIPIYEFLHEKNPGLKFFNDLTTEEIVEKGVNKEDELCNMVVNFFLQMYATEISNLACREKPLGGIYLVGIISFLSIISY